MKPPLEPIERMELFTNDRIILDLCGGTGSWSQPYRDAGYDVRIIDPLVNGQDVRLFELPEFPVHGILAAPPCTHLAASGARWWAEKGEDKLLEALSIADACLRLVLACKPVWWALENPVGRLSRFYGQPKIYFNPCDFGDDYTKRTGLWGDFRFPVKRPVEPTAGSKLWRLPPSEERWKLRSMTPQGFAKAFYQANP